jgi:hypothetical protein
MSAQLPVDGVMTPAVRNAIRSFQQQQRLTVTGIAGPDTADALKRACAGDGAQSATESESEGLGDLFARATKRVGGAVGRIADVLGGASGSRIIDLTSQSDKSVRKGTRDLKKVYALVLHQMACCFRPKDPMKRYLGIGSHFAILADGRILQLHPVSALVWASNGFNRCSVAVEFAGNFPNTRGTWWEGQKFGRNQPTNAQLEAGRYLIRYLMRTMGLTHVLAHRQSSGTRENDPGPEVWYHVGQWAVDNLELKDGGPGFKIGTGNPIPNEWRTWGRRSVARELNPELEAAQSESELAHDLQETSAESDVPAESEVATAIKGALSQLPAQQRPQYRSMGRLPEAITKVSGPGLYLILFNSGGQQKAYSGKTVSLKRRLMQHRLCAQMLGLSIDNHRVLIAPLPKADLRSVEQSINGYVRAHHGGTFTNQRQELEQWLLGESWT